VWLLTVTTSISIKSSRFTNWQGYDGSQKIGTAKRYTEPLSSVGENIFPNAHPNLFTGTYCLCSALRMVNTKPDSVRPKFRLFIRFSFHTSASKVSPRSVSSVEHLLRKGTRQIELYEDPGVKDCWVTEEMIAWNEKHKGFVQRPT
jgi:succinate dehydrogenase assembly factor 1